MHDRARRLRAASDELIRNLGVLHELETEKRQLEAGTPRFQELAAKIEELSVLVLRNSQGQRVIGESVDPHTTIERTQRPVAAVLAEWREAERRLAAAEPGSVEADAAALESDRLRDEYRDASRR